MMHPCTHLIVPRCCHEQVSRRTEAKTGYAIIRRRGDLNVLVWVIVLLRALRAEAAESCHVMR